MSDFPPGLRELLEALEKRKTDEPKNRAAVDFSTMFACELDDIAIMRRLRDSQSGESLRDSLSAESSSESPVVRAHQMRLLGVALSGGGIRSATFNLGVLQALTRYGWLRKIDYLSTVSGGGYIGTWLAAWIKRAGMNTVERKLGWRKVPQSKVDDTTGEETTRHRAVHETGAREAIEVTYLRCFSNYLTPKLGIFGGDTWTIVAAYSRNLILNLLVLMLILCVVLALPLLMLALCLRPDPNWQLLAAAVCFVIAITGLALNVGQLVGAQTTSSSRLMNRTGWVLGLIVVPVLIACWALGVYFGSINLGDEITRLVEYIKPAGTSAGFELRDSARAVLEAVPFLAPEASDGASDRLICAAFFGLFYVALWACALSVRALIACLDSARKALQSKRQQQTVGRISPAAVGVRLLRMLRNFGIWGRDAFWLLVGAALTGCIGGWILSEIKGLGDSVVGGSGWISYAAPGNLPSTIMSAELLIGFIPVLILLALEFIFVLHMGISGRAFTEETHEWNSRLVSSKLRIALAWTLLWSAFLLGQIVANIDARTLGLLAGAWLALTLAGVALGRRRGSNRPGLTRSQSLARTAPVIFVCGLVVTIVAIHAKIPWLQRFLSIQQVLYTEKLGTENPAFRVFVRILILAIIAIFASWRVGVNRFSLHALYRNRLARCFLGASNEKRNPHNFTGFDPNDDSLYLVKFSPSAPRETKANAPPEENERTYCGPYLIYNAAINLVGGDNLAWQKRKAASFIFTPNYCGFDTRTAIDRRLRERLHGERKARSHAAPAYRPTWLRNPASGREVGYGDKVNLGTAMTISGAAANPNMGYHSSPALTFLMTIFNVRLGWWFGNPKRETYWWRRDPRIGLAHLIRELLGWTDDRSAYVQLSDGGHFENLGIYELVKRRCRFIVASDATEDAQMNFGDLGNAIEKCRTDLGIEIEIDIEQLRLCDQGGRNRWHCAVGSIRYDKRENGKPMGILLYLKSSITGDEPTDVQRYAAQSPEFPHEPTSNQWFDESQFESYRALGYHIVDEVLGAVSDDKDEEPKIEQAFLFLRDRWRPEPTATAGAFASHAKAYDALCIQMRADPNLQFLDEQFFPAWSALLKGAPASPQQGSTRLWLPDKAEERRAGFYFCNQLIQLMENVYIDLNLEEQWTHPDNRGWINLFKHWSWSGTFRITWGMAASMYGSRFLRFCERRLGLAKSHVSARIHEIGAISSLDDLAPRSAEQLNRLECKIIKSFCLCSVPPPTHEVLLVTEVRDHSIMGTSTAHPVFGFAIGFALLAQKNDNAFDLIYFRLQDHLRGLGLTREALKAMLKQNKELTIPENAQPPLDEAWVQMEKLGSAKWEPHRLQHMLDGVRDEMRREK